MKQLILSIFLIIFSQLLNAQACEYCENDDVPTLTAECNGGVGAFSYTWTSPTGTTTTGATTPGNESGTWVWECTDENGCKFSGTQDVDILPVPDLSCLWRIVGIGINTNDCLVEYCVGQSVFIKVIGQTAAQNNVCTVTDPTGAIFTMGVAGSVVINNPMDGIYSVECVQANGCIAYKEFEFEQIQCCDLVIECDGTDQTCFGIDDGTASVTITGSSSYSISWSNGATTSSISNLAPGVYTVTVTDDNDPDCVETCEYEVIEGIEITGFASCN